MLFLCFLPLLSLSRLDCPPQAWPSAIRAHVTRPTLSQLGILPLEAGHAPSHPPGGSQCHSHLSSLSTLGSAFGISALPHPSPPGDPVISHQGLGTPPPNTGHGPLGQQHTHHVPYLLSSFLTPRTERSCP